MEGQLYFPVYPVPGEVVVERGQGVRRQAGQVRPQKLPLDFSLDAILQARAVLTPDSNRKFSSN